MTAIRITPAFVAAVVGAYLASALVGSVLPQPPNTPLEVAEAEAALRFAFRASVPDTGGWTAASGFVSHHPLIRAAYVTGTLRETQYSEQVLKVGWPFTIVRGFVRVAAGRIMRDGAAWLRGDATAGPVMFLPLQPVWPGLVFSGLVVTPLLLGIVYIIGRRAP